MSGHEHDFEKDFWGDCINTFDEEQKHYVYSQLMNIPRSHYGFVLKEPSKVLDVGGGPVSILLKTKNLKPGSLVVDPLMSEYPKWVKERYELANINTKCMIGEDIDQIEDKFDEAWMYNVLQHTEDPQKILRNMQEKADRIRIFEWIDIPPHDGHPHMLTSKMLNETLGVVGTTIRLNSNGCDGKAWYYYSN